MTRPNPPPLFQVCREFWLWFKKDREKNEMEEKERMHYITAAEKVLSRALPNKTDVNEAQEKNEALTDDDGTPKPTVEEVS